MFDVPVDAWYAWLGTAAVATVLLGTAYGVPTAPPPDAASAADAVDSVAASEPPARGSYRIAADAVRIGPDGLTLRSDAGVAHARFAFGPVVPVDPGTDLAAVARGDRSGATFRSGRSFRSATAEVENRPAEWREAEALVVRSVSLGGEDATLVLAA
ncbi:DUF7283 family protein [Halorarum salinum]|uniref:Uncharacterized protein n=1 Tax=Halorarum salinum TaxID=2743089 RepID=A0A7D5QB14_9EURY|nr:hypothetical protein [Halobaculum salinum]QLG62996.1 hypothetical protein HUG12_15150 [Halobaculum salinum]